MEISVIASGSNGNCYLVESKKTSVLVEAGKSGREIEQRMDSLGKSPENIDAVVVSHSHHDHIAGAGVLSRRYNLPIYMSKEVFSEARFKLGNVSAKVFAPDKPFKVKGIKLRPIPTSHNVASCGFVINRFGLFTDTGIVTKEMKMVLPKLKGVLLESNHDIDMLINGPYPYFLKKWILSDIGHLSNVHASEFIQNKGKNLSLVLLGHLSGNNNTPEVAKKTFETLVKRRIEYHVCSREKESGSWRI